MRARFLVAKEPLLPVEVLFPVQALKPLGERKAAERLGLPRVLRQRVSQTGGGVEEHQRLFLLRDFQTTVDDFSKDVDRDGNLTPRTILLIEEYERAIAWLRGKRTAAAQVRAFLVERLEVVDRELNYKVIVYEHDAYAAAIEALR